MFIKRGDGKILNVFIKNTKAAIDALINSPSGVFDASSEEEDDQKTKEQLDSLKNNRKSE